MPISSEEFACKTLCLRGGKCQPQGKNLKSIVLIRGLRNGEIKGALQKNTL
eukprot:c37975_g1_i1 orf=177-329(-)